jgi:hypothetical protein
MAICCFARHCISSMNVLVSPSAFDSMGKLVFYLKNFHETTIQFLKDFCRLPKQCHRLSPRMSLKFRIQPQISTFFLNLSSSFSSHKFLPAVNLLPSRLFSLYQIRPCTFHFSTSPISWSCEECSTDETFIFISFIEYSNILESFFRLFLLVVEARAMFSIKFFCSIFVEDSQWMRKYFCIFSILLPSIISFFVSAPKIARIAHYNYGYGRQWWLWN